MGSATATAVSLPLGRLAGVGLIIFLANAAMLVLQLVAGRLLASFVGSSLETWTSIIGVFLVGIALGNALGGKLADRYPTPRTLAILLAVGALAALWMVPFPMLLEASGAYKSIPLGVRIPVLAALLCLPAGFVLSLLTPLAIKLGLPDVSKTGRVSGLIFALSTLGCLLGNYLTGFVLMKTFTINMLVFLSAGSLGLLAVMTMLILRDTPDSSPSPLAGEGSRAAAGEGSNLPNPNSNPSPGGEAPSPSPARGKGNQPPAPNPYAFPDIRLAFVVVFLASFGGMTLELTASRVLAEQLGVSLFTWTGIIGVMLAGTACGNFTGGLVADRVNRPGSTIDPRTALASTLISAGGVTVLLLLVRVILRNRNVFDDMDLITQVVAWTFSLFFLPMFLLGMVSPQVIRLAVPDMAHAGRVAGRVYAWSTAGAIVGTFAAGYVLLSTLGMNKTILTVAFTLAMTSLIVAKVWEGNLMLYLFSLVMGGVAGGLILNARPGGSDPRLVAQIESNYYTIKVTEDMLPIGKDPEGNEVLAGTGFRNLYLDHLLHSSVDPKHPDKLHYTHEYVQMEFLRGAWANTPAPRVLVIGGGGYTFPRYAMEIAGREHRPDTRMDVVEIDPGVTKAAREHLGLKDYAGLNIVHMDGRQFVAEKAAPGTYDLVIQDAVNDFSVPSHLLTKEYNDAVKRAMKPGGVYLLTIIDSVEYGKLWKAAIHTLRETYPPENVRLLLPDHAEIGGRQVFVIYASDQKLDLVTLRIQVETQLAAQLEALRATIGAGNNAITGTAGALPGGMFHALLAAAASPTLEKEATVFRSREVPLLQLQPYLDVEPIILRDQYAPVDNLMAEVFRYRNHSSLLEYLLGYR